jgi:hypothetical protein
MAINVYLDLQFGGVLAWKGVQEKGGNFRKIKDHTRDEIQLGMC